MSIKSLEKIEELEELNYMSSIYSENNDAESLMRVANKMKKVLMG